MPEFIPPRPTGSDAEALFMQWVYDRLLGDRLLSSPGVRVSRTTRGMFITPLAPSRGTSSSSSPAKPYRVVGIVAADQASGRTKAPLRRKSVLLCREIDPITLDWASEVDTLVAKPHELQQEADGLRVEGQAVTFDYENRLFLPAGATTEVQNPDGQRRARVGSSTGQVEIVLPMYCPDERQVALPTEGVIVDGVEVGEVEYGYYGAVIYADEPPGGTNLTVNGVRVTWMDQNRAGRMWCRVD